MHPPGERTNNMNQKEMKMTPAPSSGATCRAKGQYQREFRKQFDTACSRHNRWQVWSDFVIMCAISISNAIDCDHAKAREETYLSLAKKYNEKELHCFTSMFVAIIHALEVEPDQDFLGELFMSFGLSNESGGQFFTPYHVCTMMAKINLPTTAEISKKGWISVNDPACGAGALLIAYANECRLQGINYQTSVLFAAQDIDLIAGCMCYIQLSLLGCPGYVTIANSITNPCTCLDEHALVPVYSENIWYTPAYYREEWTARRILWQLSSLIQRSDDQQNRKTA